MVKEVEGISPMALQICKSNRMRNGGFWSVKFGRSIISDCSTNFRDFPIECGEIASGNSFFS
jgi:hypothetical protein